MIIQTFTSLFGGLLTHSTVHTSELCNRLEISVGDQCDQVTRPTDFESGCRVESDSFHIYIKREYFDCFIHHANMSVSRNHPYTPLLYSKVGVCRGICHHFFCFARKHRLWVVVKTASLRRF